MKSKSVLRTIRIFLAVIVILPFTFLFIDFGISELRPLWWLPEIQFTPAVLSLIAGMGSALVIVFILLLTVLFGRVYCSVICPFGIMQDVFKNIFNIGKKKNKRKKYKYSKPMNVLRYSILAVTIIILITGYSALVLYIDPYSNFGRIAKNVLGPVYMGVNNLFASLGISSLYRVSPKSFELFSLGFSIFVLLGTGLMVFLRGRLFCNSICPVGAVLSLFSRFSLFKLKLDSEKCNSCGLCAMKCKAECIDTKNKKLDFSRCVTCYNCIDTCNRQAVGYKFSWKTDKTKTVEPKQPVQDNIDTDKRRFLATSATVLGTAVVANAQRQRNRVRGEHSYEKHSPISPPGSKSIKNLLSKCTACHLCVAQCPTQVLKPAFMEYGLAGMMMPVMNYNADFCNFECTLCSEICPNGAIQPLSVEEKKQTQIGKVFFVKQLCVVYTDETSCGACSEHCPTKAVDMVPYKGVLTIPQINQDICIGCGGCEYICPVRPLRAIYIDGNPIHQIAEKPVEDNKEEIELDGFGF